MRPVRFVQRAPRAPLPHVSALACPGTLRDEGASIRKLMEMGFAEEQCKDALKQCGGDENRALDKLLGSM